MVQEVSVSFEQSNMSLFLSRGQMFSNPDIFLRELLKNAVDACNMREALELSWGMSFLEQISSHSTMVRKAYEPRIVITYDSKSKVFSVEDNGFGMNEEDLQDYVTKFGESYYRSENFALQHLEFEPVSRDGIGLFTCFAVSKAVLIESKKHHSINTAWLGNNRQSLDAITVKWFENSDKIEYIKSTKGAPGTKISLALKPFYAEKISMNFIVQRMEHFMLQSSIPIEICVDGKRKVLEGKEQALVNPFSHILGMTGIQIKEDWIEGYLVLHSKRQSYIVGKSSLFQKGFRILERGEDLELCPAWLENMHFALNLRQHFYTLKLLGDGVVKDENWNTLREAIGTLILNHFKKNPMSICQYLADGSSNILTEYENEMEFISKAVIANVFWKNQDMELSVEQIVLGLKGRKKTVLRMPKALFSYFRSTYPFEFRALMETKPLIIFEQNYKLLSQLLAPFAESQIYVIRELPGISYIQMELDFGREGNYGAYRNHYDLYPTHCSRDDILCYVINECPEYFELQLNHKHPMVKLLEQNHHPRLARLKGIITENIKYRILQSHNRWSNIMDFGGIRVDAWTLEEPVTMKAKWCLEENFAESLNRFIESQFTPYERHELGIEKLIFRKEDFIEWWYSSH